MAGRYSGDRVITPHKRKLLRKEFPAHEFWSSVAIVAVLVAAGAWVWSQHDAYDPGSRDISSEVLVASAVEDTLWRAPLQRWHEGGAPMAPGGALAPVELGIFPPSLVADGWTIDGRVQTFDPDNLYEKINGQAEQYLAYGFKRLHFVTLTKNDVFLTLELYDQGSFPNALGVFAAQRAADRPTESAGEVVFEPNPIGGRALYRNYYGKIAASAETPEVATKARALASLVGSLPAVDASESRAYRVLSSGLALPFEAIAFERDNVFQLGFFKNVWMGRLANLEGARVFLHEAKDASEADRTFSQLIEEQSYEYQVVARDTARVTLRHEYLGTVFTVAREGALIAGVEGAPDTDSAATQLARVLDGRATWLVMENPRKARSDLRESSAL
ncbi:MAG: hypothetical protein HC882_09855, partial [Acidobacteria bacterium]|nr:hypothetical protein [Acidobacteriota bacterium]